ncbi:3'-5' exoribonuclease HELZ2-like [Haliotis asinina]|uniref:3'-5' exoribonuclease HELZ2-like n=1 Tax=Haliotis asinina TaxID=109174 RepID=UPI0035325BDB
MDPLSLLEQLESFFATPEGSIMGQAIQNMMSETKDMEDLLQEGIEKVMKSEFRPIDWKTLVTSMKVCLSPAGFPEKTRALILICQFTEYALTQGCDIFQAFHYFYRTMILLDIAANLDGKEPGRELVINMACSCTGSLLWRTLFLDSNMWRMNETSTLRMLRDLRELVFENMKENPAFSYFLCLDLIRAYMVAGRGFPLKQKTRTRGDLILLLAKCSYQAGQYRLCTRYSKEACELFDCSSYIPYELWARALHKSGQYRAALDKVECAKECIQDKKIKEHLQKYMDQLHQEMSASMQQPTAEPDADWLTGTNISTTQLQQARAQQVKNAHVKKKRHSRPTRREPVEPIHVSHHDWLRDGAMQNGNSVSRQNTRNALPLPTAGQTGMAPSLLSVESNPLLQYTAWDTSSGDDGSDLEDAFELRGSSSSQHEENEPEVTKVVDEKLDKTWYEESKEMYDNCMDTKITCGMEMEVETESIEANEFKQTRPHFYRQMEPVFELRRLMATMPDKYKQCKIEFESSHKAVCKVLPGGETYRDIEIHGRSKCGQTFNNDEVCVEILSEPQSNPVSGHVIYKRTEEDDKVYGRVVGVLNSNFREESHIVMACTCDDDEGFLMHPLCKTVPKIHVLNGVTKKKYPSLTKYRIDTYEINEKGKLRFKKYFDVKPGLRGRYVFLVVYLTWGIHHVYPLGAVVDILDCGTDFKGGLKILEMQYKVPTYFPQDSVAHIGKILEKKAVDNDGRVDCTGLEVFTIDPAHSKDLDDALSISKKDDHYLIGVHIADVAAVVKKGDPVDREAQKRATSFYPCESRTHHMLPEPLSEGLCSLLPHEEKLALSVFFHMEKSGKLLKEPAVMKTRIKSSCKLSYEDAQKIIENEEVSDVSQSLKDSITLLHEIAQSLRKDRLNDSRFAVPFEDPRFIETEILEQNMEAHALVEEFMIKANTSIAQWLRKKFPHSIPIRCQPPPSTEDVQKFVQSEEKFLDFVVNLQGREVLPGKKVASKNWVAKGNTVRKETLPVQRNIWLQILDGVHNGTLDKTVRNMCKDEVHPFQAIALQYWRSIMESAEYKCSVLSENELSHFSLKIKMYTHFTSPIRRYVDLVVHRLVHAALDGTPCPYSATEITDLCVHINNATSRQKHFSNGCQALKRAAKISQRPMVFNAVVEKVTDSGAELCIPSLKHISSRSKELPFNLMDFSKKPEEKQDPWSSKTIITGKWKKRLYDCTGCPSQLTYSKMLEKQQGAKQKRLKQVVSVVDPNQHVYFVDTQTWAKMLNALFSQDLKTLKKMVNSQPQDRQELTSGEPVRDMVTSEYGDGSIKFQQCKFTLCFKPGRVIKVQMVANPMKGLLTPQVRLFQVCKNLSLCLSHIEDPVGVLSKYATESAKKNIESISEYHRAWLPLLEMESATSAVRSEENATINNVNIEFKRNQGKNKTFYKGTFTFPSSFVHERCIEFGGKPLEKLKEEGDEDDDERDNFGRREFSSIDYLCIRCKIDQNKPKPRETEDEDISTKVIEVSCPLKKDEKPTKPSKRSKSAEKRRSRRKAVAVECALKEKKQYEGPGLQADACSQADTYTWVGHAQILKVRRRKDKEMESDFVTVTFSINANSGSVPEELFPSCTGIVEVIFKSEVDRRTMRMVQSLNGDKSDLASCIALHRRPPKLDKDRLDYGKKMEKEVPVQGLPLNNPMQHEAIHRALCSSFTLIQGPPGTGKTYTGIKLVYLFNKINKFLHLEGVDVERKQVLFCGPSNKAVDLVARLLLRKLGDACPNIIRLYGSNIVAQDYPVPKRTFMSKRSMRDLRSDPELFHVSLHHMIRKTGKPHAEEIRMYDKLFRTNPESVTVSHIKKYGKLVYNAACEELTKCDVILCTCLVAGTRKLTQSTRIFQVIIDECAMSTEPQSMIPIIATKAKQVVLIGDHKQLRPIVQCKLAAELGLDQSLFERFAAEATFLNTQYRMHPRICDFPSEEFYSGRLTTSPSVAWKGEPLALWPVPRVPHVLCHVEGVEESLSVSVEEGNEQSKSNREEVDKVVEVFTWLVQKGGVLPRYINVMSQYNAQCSKIREALSKYYQNINVNTVVASQGGEWDYVIFSTVRSLPHYKIEKRPTLGWSKHNLGFITDANQINVALTRSHKGLIIIGNENLLRTDKIFQKLIDKYQKQGCLVDGSEFPRRYHSDHKKRRPPVPGLEWKTA